MIGPYLVDPQASVGAFLDLTRVYGHKLIRETRADDNSVAARFRHIAEVTPRSTMRHQSPTSDSTLQVAAASTRRTKRLGDARGAIEGDAHAHPILMPLPSPNRQRMANTCQFAVKVWPSELLTQKSRRRVNAN